MSFTPDSFIDVGLWSNFEEYARGEILKFYNVPVPPVRRVWGNRYGDNEIIKKEVNIDKINFHFYNLLKDMKRVDGEKYKIIKICHFYINTSNDIYEDTSYTILNNNIRIRYLELYLNSGWVLHGGPFENNAYISQAIVLKID